MTAFFYQPCQYLAPSIAPAALLLVAVRLVKVVKINGPTNVLHPPIHQDLASDGSEILVGGGSMEVAVAVVTF